ncbi:hypothetical protein [Natronomonas sp. EA1]
MAVEHRREPGLAAMKLEDGAVIIFDPSEDEAWIQSDAPVDPPA